MDHAEVIERLEDAFVGPGKLATIESDHSLEGQELRRHLTDCPTCLAEVRGLQLTAVALDAATPETLRAPAEARGRILAAVAANGVPRGAAAQPAVQAAPAPTLLPVEPAPAPLPAAPALPPPAIRRGGRGWGVAASAQEERHISFRWMALAAAALVLVFVAGALLGPVLGLGTGGGSGDTDGDGSKIFAAVERIVSAPGHTVARLATTDGSHGGVALTDPATTELVVTSAALDQQAGTYWCYVVRGGERTKIGLMHFNGSVAYWAGRVSDPAEAGRPGDVFEVSLEGSAAPTLSGTFQAPAS